MADDERREWNEWSAPSTGRTKPAWLILSTLLVFFVVAAAAAFLTHP